jgi:Zn-dependent peptidase ImmA (M78 family)
MDSPAIRRKAERVLDAAGVAQPPVPVEQLARQCGAVVRYQPFADQLSGMLVRRGKDWIIGVNSLDAEARQRFTIAHELGHLLIHGKTDAVFVDRSFPVRFRDSRAATGTDPREVEANRFAAELLMPAGFLLDDLAEEEETDGLDADELITRLARRYDVSEQAMTIRLTNLGLGDVLGSSLA